MRVLSNGWLSGVCRLVSPNCDARPLGAKVELLVIHNISLPPGKFGGGAVAQLFTNTLDAGAHPYFEQLQGLRVSSHFFIRRGGQVIQFVSCSKRAWHAGVSSWQGRSRCNDFSIGVELEGDDFTPYTDAQYSSLARLTRKLRHRYPLSAMAGHSEIAPERKTDPGVYFDWERYLASVR